MDEIGPGSSAVERFEVGSDKPLWSATKAVNLTACRNTIL
jgi:hypothetical protein